MSRTLSQIYTDAVKTRNNYLQLTELQPTDLSTSKLSVLDLITYVISVVIYTYETILDVFQLDIISEVNKRMNGTAEYYVRKAKLFQFNSESNQGDEIIFNEDTLNMEYAITNENHRIITKAASQYDNDDKLYDMTLKVCKEHTEGGESGVYECLSDYELTAFKKYIETIKFIGTEIRCISAPGDILTINSTIYYDDSYITGEQAYEAICAAVIDYITNLEYNNYVYYQKIIDSLQEVEHIKYVDGNTKIYLQSASNAYNEYAEIREISNIDCAYSGYLILLDQEGESTLTYEVCASAEQIEASTKNIKLAPISIL